MIYDTMDPEVIKEIISGEADAISDALKEEALLYGGVRCPNCGSQGATKKMDPPTVLTGPEGPIIVNSPFKSDSPLVCGYAHCPSCGADFDPYTGVIRRAEQSLISCPPSNPHPL